MPKRDNAIFSKCRTYRYALFRWWDKEKPYVNFIGLNPSTADETKDDPTIRRCIRFAKDWGYGGLCMTNLFAFRATDPKAMKAHPFPIGPDNTKHIMDWSSKASMIVFAWGTHGIHEERDMVITDLIPNGMCLGKTKNGHPRHPLYMKATTKLRMFDEK